MAESTGSAPCPWAPLSCARSNGPSPVTHFPPPPPCGISGTDLEGGLGGHFEFLCKFSVPPTVPVFRIQDGRNRRREPGCKSEGKEGRRPRRHLQSRHPGGALRPGWSQATHGEVGGGRGQEVCLAGAGRKAWVGEAVALDQRSSVGRGRKAASGDIPAHHDWGCCWRHGPHYPGWPQKSEVLRLRNAGLEQCVSSFNVCTHLLEA